MLLNTIGVKTGKPRTNPLVYLSGDDCLYVFATKGGSPAHPDWYLNLVANPEIELVTADGETLAVTARTASDDERDEMWPKIVDVNKRYAGYAKKANRKIPVVVCEPREN